MEQAVKESAGVTRGQNVLYQLPHDWASIATFLGPVLDRIDADLGEVQLLVVTADAEAAAAITAAAIRLAQPHEVAALAATSARRATRLLRARPAQVVAGAPEELLALMQGATLKLEHVKVIVLAWVDELVATTVEPSLETLLGDAPKEAARVVVASAITPAVEALVERYARRARRVGVSGEGTAAPVELGYVTVAPTSRLTALRRILDELDPSTAVVYVRSDESERQVRDALRALGYADADGVRVSRGAGPEAVEVVILFDLPATSEELHEAMGARAGRVVAMTPPRQLASLATLSGGGAVTPLTLRGPGSRARQREAALRAELRETLSSGAFARELLALEPLLEDFDGIEIAAAALQLLERARAVPRPGAPTDARSVATGAATRPAGGGTVRLFVNVGGKDGVGPADLVGAITSEAGVGRDTIGKVEIRDTHSLVEVDAGLGDAIATKLTGTMIRGRRVQARVDQDRSLRGGRRDERGGRSERGAPHARRGEGRPPRRDDRAPREGFAERGRDHGDRPARRSGEARGEGRRHEHRGPRGRGEPGAPREPRWDRE